MTSASTTVHPLAVVEDGAQLGDGASVGPFCRVSSKAVIGARTRLLSHVVIDGATTLGTDCVVHPFASLGVAPQSTGHKGGRSELRIGDRCTIREYVSMSAGTDFGGGVTSVGNNGHFLAYAHIAHDCHVGNNVTLTNGVTLGGHCEIGDFVGIGGLSAVHQFVRVGHNAFLAGGSMIVGDVIPYAMASGNRATLRGLNVVGLKRSGMTRADMHVLRKTYRMIFDDKAPMAENLQAARETFGDSAIALKVIDFLTARGKRQFTLPRRRGGADDEIDDQD